MRDGLGMTADEMHEVFKEWNEGELKRYLIEITRDILAYKDGDGSPLIDKILDAAGQKGTGKWTVVSSLDEGVALTLIGEAVFGRCLSAIKDERVAAATRLAGPDRSLAVERKTFLDSIRKALFASKIVSYAQGFAWLKSAAATYGWDLKYGDIAMMWRGGCIIRSAFLGDIKNAFNKNPDLSNLMTDDYFMSRIRDASDGWREVCAKAMLAGIPIPAFASALNYYDGYRCGRLPANLLQAQRDYFGAHTYERVDRPRGEFFHTNWTGEGGQTASSTYSV
jgi:6-phosphogluconate dehydrogenase